MATTPSLALTFLNTLGNIVMKHLVKRHDPKFVNLILPIFFLEKELILDKNVILQFHIFILFLKRNGFFFCKKIIKDIYFKIRPKIDGVSNFQNWVLKYLLFKSPYGYNLGM